MVITQSMISLLLHESTAKPKTSVNNKEGYNLLISQRFAPIMLLCTMNTMASTGCVTYVSKFSLYSMF